MTEYDFKGGTYPFPLSYLPSDGGLVTRPYVSGNPNDALDSGDNFYIICCTSDEFTSLLSAIAVGAPQINELNYNVLDQIIMQAYEFPNGFGGASCMDLCDLLLQCLQTDTAVQQEIARLSNTASIDDTTPQNSTNEAVDLFGSPATCDNDQIFGMVVQFTALLNVVSEDILEKAVNGFSLPGRLGDMIEAIPVIGEMPFDDIAQFTEALATDVNDAYVAAYDTALSEDIACGLFCLTQDDCELTMATARDYFKGLLIDFISGLNMLDIIGDILDGAWLGDQAVYMMHYFILETLIIGGEILGVDVDRLATTIATYYNDPDSDWSTLCTSCVWSYVALGGSGNPVLDGWTIEYGTYNAIDDTIENGEENPSSDVARVRFTVPAGLTANITKMIVNGVIVNPGTARDQRVTLFDSDDVVIVESETSTNQDGIHIETWDGNQALSEGDYFEYQIATANNAGTPFSAIMRSMVVQGTGDNPFI